MIVWLALVSAYLLGAAVGLWLGGKIVRFLREIAYPWIERWVRRG